MKADMKADAPAFGLFTRLPCRQGPAMLIIPEAAPKLHFGTAGRACPTCSSGFCKIGEHCSVTQPWDGIVSNEQQEAYKAAGFGRQVPHDAVNLFDMAAKYADVMTTEDAIKALRTIA